MTNKFLLNLLGFNPTSRQSRSDSLSLVSRQSDLLTHLGRIAAILLLVLTIGVGNVWGADYTCTFTKLTSGSEISSYTNSHTFTSGSVTWTVYGNQSVDDSDIRVGGKNTSNTDRTLTSGKISISVSKFTINHLGTGNGKSSSITINSIKLEVANNSSFTGADVITKSSPSVSSSGSLEYIPTSGTSWAANSYYRVTVNYKITGSNNCYIKIGSFVCKEASSCTSISPSLSYAGGTSLTVGATSGSPTVSGNTGSGAVTYSVTAASPAGCATVNSSTGVVTAVAAGTATITASIAANGGYCSGSATANFTITVPAYTVQFSTGTGNPTVSSRTEASGGAGITLPDGPTPTCSGDGWSFAGWKETSAVTSETTVAPTLLSAGSTYHPTGNVTLYAVYAKEGYAREKSSITSGSKYLIVANYDSKNYVMTDSYSLDGDSEGHMGSQQVDEDEDDFYLASSIDSDWRYSIEGTPSHYDIRDVKNSSSANYLDIAYKDWYGKGDDNTDEWIITVSSGNWTLQNEYYSNYLAFNTTNKVFERGSGTVWLYKQVTVYFSNPTCCTPLGTINGSFLWTAYFIARKPFCRACFAAL